MRNVYLLMKEFDRPEPVILSGWQDFKIQLVTVKEGLGQCKRSIRPPTACLGRMVTLEVVYVLFLWPEVHEADASLTDKE